jgi:cyclohexanecarboxylate-CoA ligase
MTVPAFDLEAHGRAMRAGGFWLDRTVDDYLVEAIARTPDKAAVIGYRVDRPTPARLTYAELGDKVARAAGALRRLGVGHGDVIAVQLPNWWEFVVVALAGGRLGAVVNPLMPIFRERELGYMLGFAEAKVLVVPKLFRGFDHEAMAAGMRAELPKLQHVIVVDGEGANGFQRLLLEGGDQSSRPRPPNRRSMPTISR